jgi:hypothetical protein
VIGAPDIWAQLRAFLARQARSDRPQPSPVALGELEDWLVRACPDLLGQVGTRGLTELLFDEPVDILRCHRSTVADTCEYLQAVALATFFGPPRA